MGTVTDATETDSSLRTSGTDSGLGDSDGSRSSITCLKKEHSDAVYRHFRYLKDQIYLQPLVDRFYELGYLDIDDIDEISSQPTRRKSVDIFLRRLLRFREDGYEHLLDCLKQSDQCHIADTLQGKRFPSELPATTKSDVEVKAIILMNVDALCDDLEPDKDADYFIVYRVITIDEYESIICHGHRRKKAEEMVFLILEHLPEGYQVLRQIYKETGKTKMLKALDETVVVENQNEINENIRETFESKRRQVHCTHCGSGNLNTKMKISVTGSTLPTYEKELVRRIEGMIEEINLEIQKHTGCKIVLVKEGSIVIHLVTCGKFLHVKDEEEQDVSELLYRIFLHPGISAFDSNEGLRFSVTIKSNINLPLDGNQNFGKVKKGSIESYRDFLIEELSAVPFLHHKKARTIFKKSEYESVLECTKISREKSMQKLLPIILRKGKRAVQYFEMVLKEENHTNVLKQLCQGKSRKDDLILSGNYSALLDEMSPSLIVEECKTNGIENCIPLRLDMSQNRRKQCEAILQNALSQDQDTKEIFFYVLEKNYPEYLGFVATSEKPVVGSRSYALLDTEDVGWNVIYEGDHDMKRSDLTQAKEDIRCPIDPDHLTSRKENLTIFSYSVHDAANAVEDTAKYEKHMLEARNPTDIMRATDTSANQETNNSNDYSKRLEDLSRSIKSNASSGYCTDNDKELLEGSEVNHTV